MSDFLLELYSEEIPHGLQINTRKSLEASFLKSLEDENIKCKKLHIYSTPSRICVFIEGLPATMNIAAKEIKGPKVGTPPQALEGFLKSNQLHKSDVFEKETDKGNFYLAKTKKQTVDLKVSFQTIVPEILKNINWKKSMRWSDHDLSWGRPLKSILCLFDASIVPFHFYHLQSTNKIFLGGPYDEKPFVVKNAMHYFTLLKDKKIILDHEERKKIILNNLII